MQPVLYYLMPSAPCRAVLILGRMINVDFDLRPVDISKGEHLKPEFIQINPQHVVPTLEDHGLVLWESRAIMTYLVAAYSKDDALYPRDIRVRALIDQRLQFDLGTLYARLIDYCVPTIFLGAPLDESKKARLEEALGWLEALLRGHNWSAANHFTLADLSLGTTVFQIEAFDFDLKPYPRVRAWLQKYKDELEPYGFDEIMKSGAETLAGMFRAKLKS